MNPCDSNIISTIKDEGPGVLYIFNHKKFDIKLDLLERKGTKHDVKALQEAFGKYDVKNEVFDDLPINGIREKFIEMSIEDFSKNSCIVVAILTHGEPNNILAAQDAYYNLYDMVSIIATNITLKSKPKIFLLQACRGYINLVELRYPNIRFDGTTAIRNRTYNCDELYILHSTTETIQAFRLEDRGSFFIQSFCKFLVKYGNEKTINEIFHEVIREIKIILEGCQLPTISVNTEKSYTFGKYCKNDTDARSSNQQVRNIEQEKPDNEIVPQRENLFENQEFLDGLYESWLDNFVD